VPDLLDDLRRLGGPDRAPSDDARALTLRRLQREIDAELATGAGSRQRPRLAGAASAAARRARPRPRVVAGAATAVAIVAAGVSALVPASGPGAQEILERAAAAVGAGEQPEILTADIRAEQLAGSAVSGSYGTTRVWVRQVPGRGTPEFRSLQLAGPHAGNELVSFPSPGTALPFTSEEYSAADDRIVVRPGTQSAMTPELFEARTLLARARQGDDVALDDNATVNGRPAYRLTWREDTSRAPNDVTVEVTLWIDRDTYAPLQFTDHDTGTDAQGRPLDQTYRATILDFERLPDTAANRELLEMRPHPGAERVTRP
jgi:hypothetical protein